MCKIYIGTRTKIACKHPILAFFKLIFVEQINKFIIEGNSSIVIELWRTFNRNSFRMVLLHLLFQIKSFIRIDFQICI